MDFQMKAAKLVAASEVPAVPTAPLTDYEILRAANIARIRSKLPEFGLAFPATLTTPER